MCDDVEMHDATPVVSEHDEDEQDPERDRGNREVVEV
jgi:hypothetical protein